MPWLKSMLNIRERFKLRAPPADSTIPNAAWFKSDQAQDLYARLGVKPTASLSDIRRAYRTRAKVFHPDVKPDDRASEDAFKLVSEAFAVLSDVEKRRHYDESRQEQASNRPEPQRHKQRFPGQFTRGFVSGMLTASCLVSVIFLSDAKRRKEVRTILAVSMLAEYAAMRNARPLHEDEMAPRPAEARDEEIIDTASAVSAESERRSSQDSSSLQNDKRAPQAVDAKRKEEIGTASAITTQTTGSAAQDANPSQNQERASREVVDIQTDREDQKKKQTGALSLKDVGMEVTSNAASTESATGGRHQPEKSHLAEAELPTEADTKAETKQVALAVDMRELHHGSEISPPAAGPDAADSAHVEADKDDGEPSASLAALPGAAPAISKADRRREPADPVNYEEVRTVVTRQIKAFRRRDGRAAFAIASPAVQSRFRDAHKFLEMVKTSYPDISASKTATFLGLVRTRDEVIARFLLEGSNGRSVEARYYMVRLADRWRIDGCVVVPR